MLPFMESILFFFAALNGVIIGIMIWDHKIRLTERVTYRNLHKETEEILKGIQTVHNGLVTQMTDMRDLVNKHEMQMRGR